MYIGSTGERGLHHLVTEVVDNSVDEALAGHCDRIDVTILADGGVRVERQRPWHPRRHRAGPGLPAVEVVLTVLHAGGKFGGGGYKVSGGLHGVGVSVVNALSSRLEVEVRNRGHCGASRYDRRARRSAREGAPDGDRRATGTTMTFWADRRRSSRPPTFDFETSRPLREWRSSTRA